MNIEDLEHRDPVELPTVLDLEKARWVQFRNIVAYVADVKERLAQGVPIDTVIAETEAERIMLHQRASEIEKEINLRTRPAIVPDVFKGEI